MSAGGSRSPSAGDGVRDDDTVIKDNSEGGLLPVGYGDLLAQVKREVREARLRAARVVNSEVIELNWRIGKLILDGQENQG